MYLCQIYLVPLEHALLNVREIVLEHVLPKMHHRAGLVAVRVHLVVPAYVRQDAPIRVKMHVQLLA